MNGREHVAADNLRLWREQLADNRELRHLQLGMLAKELADTLTEREEFPLDLPELWFPAAAGAWGQAVTTDERLALCRALIELHPDLLPTEEPLAEPPECPRVAQLAGEVFSQAAKAFAPLLPNARPLLLSSISELLEAVASGEADFALLPLEDSNGIRFLRFYEELERLELHVTHTCDMTLGEEARPDRFALISRQYRPQVALPADLVLECRVSGDVPHALHELLTVAADTDMLLRRSDARPISYAEGKFNHYPVLLAPKDTRVFELYLRLFLPSAAIMGRYLHVKGTEV